MIKNAIISGLGTALLFSIMPNVDINPFMEVFGIVVVFAMLLWLVADTEETIRSHTGYKARRAFRRMINKTTMRKVG